MPGVTDQEELHTLHDPRLSPIGRGVGRHIVRPTPHPRNLIPDPLEQRRGNIPFGE